MKTGLKKGQVELREFSLNWIEEFQKEKKKLSALLKNDCIYIEHIGSTCIPTIKAKPIVDILLVVPSDYDLNIATERLESINFFKGEFQRESEVFYIKGNGNFHTHYLHLLKENQDWQRFVLFRDYLKSNVDIAREYENLKVHLATTYKNNRKIYTSSKYEFVERVLLELRK